MNAHEPFAEDRLTLDGTFVAHAPLCRGLASASTEAERRRCYQDAVFVPEGGSFPDDLCFYHLRRHIGDARILEWVNAITSAAGARSGLADANLQGMLITSTDESRHHIGTDLKFRRCCLEDAQFVRVAAPGIRFEDCFGFTNVKFVQCDLRDAGFAIREFRNVEFYDCDLSDACFDGPPSTGADGVIGLDCTLKRVKFKGSKLNHLLLYNTTLEEVDFVDAKFKRLSINGGSWKNVDLSMAQIARDSLCVSEPVRMDGCVFPASLCPDISMLKSKGLLLEQGAGIRFGSPRHPDGSQDLRTPDEIIDSISERLDSLHGDGVEDALFRFLTAFIHAGFAGFLTLFVSRLVRVESAIPSILVFFIVLMVPLLGHVRTSKTPQ